MSEYNKSKIAQHFTGDNKFKQAVEFVRESVIAIVDGKSGEVDRDKLEYAYQAMGRSMKSDLDWDCRVMRSYRKSAEAAEKLKQQGQDAQTEEANLKAELDRLQQEFYAKRREVAAARRRFDDWAAADHKMRQHKSDNPQLFADIDQLPVFVPSPVANVNVDAVDRAASKYQLNPPSGK